MAFIELGLGDDVQEKECAPEGEYDLVAISVKVKEKEYDNGVKGSMIEIVHEIESIDGPYRSIYTYLSLPNKGDDKEKTYNKQAGVKRYLQAAEVPYESSGFSPEDIQGCRFSSKLKVESDENGKYPDKNVLVLPSIAT